MPALETREAKDIKVLIGQVHLTRPPHRLHSVLGSCIGLVLYDPEIHLAGMAHILLPHSGGREPGSLPGKYADHAVDCLLRALQTHGAARSRLRCKLAGGARMFDHAMDYHRDIGASNIASVETVLHAAGIQVLAKHVGGNLGRRIEFMPDTHTLLVEDFAQQQTRL